MSFATSKIVFPHIMKTAGTSVIAWIQRHYAFADILLAATTWPELARLPRGATDGKRFVRGHFGSGILRLFGEDKGFVPIAVLRDPVERVVSHFWHLKYSPEDHPFPFVRDPSFTIEQFIEHAATRCVVANYQTTNYSATPESNAAPDLETRVLEEVSPLNLGQAKAFIDSCAVIGLTEDLPGFIGRMSTRFGFFADQKLPKHRSYRGNTPVSDNVLKKIHDLNEADRELYEYVRERAEAPRTHYSLAAPRNPNAVDSDGILRWTAGMPYWGRGWSDVMDDRNKHLWSLDSAASFEFVVQPGESYTLLFSTLRFVSPVQRECFSVVCNGREVAAVPVFVRGGDDFEVWAATLGVVESAKLTLGFQVSTLLAFRLLSKDPDSLRRGVALASLALLPNRAGAAGAKEPALPEFEFAASMQA